MLPFDFTVLHKTIKGYISELIENVDQLREKAMVENNLINNKAYVIAADPTEKISTPSFIKEVPFIDFSPILNALSNLEKSAKHLEQVKQSADVKQLNAINAKIRPINYLNKKKVYLLTLLLRLFVGLFRPNFFAQWPL